MSFLNLYICDICVLIEFLKNIYKYKFYYFCNLSKHNNKVHQYALIRLVLLSIYQNWIMIKWTLELG